MGKSTHSPRMQSMQTTERHEAEWNAVVERDRARDGSFVFAVKTTGVYCRPSCPARRPRRENVSFFATPGDAERDGFRACKRCKPRDLRSPTDALAVKVKTLLDDAIARGADKPPTLEALGMAAGASPFHMQRVFVRAFGVSPREYVEKARAERFRERAKDATSVLDAAFDAGYGSSRAVYDAATNAFGMTPGAYRRGGAGERVIFTTARTPYGLVLVATSARGIVKVSLGERDADLEAELARELPHAELVRDDHALRTTVRAVLAFAERAAVELPLDLRGTAFELRVWNALRRIPPGETRTYSEVARALGAPRSVRAVARACAKNKIALVVPCHRVIGTDGGLHGYRWGGVTRKRALLDAEEAAADPKSVETSATTSRRSNSTRRSSSLRRRPSQTARP